MEKKDKNRTCLSTEELKILMDKYYEGETNCEEERIIRLYLNQDNPISKQFKDDINVQSYISVFLNYEDQKMKIKNKNIYLRKIVIRSIISVAAMFLGFFLVPKFSETDDCIMYAYGKRVDNEEKIMTHLNLVILELDFEGTDIENQLSEVFN